MAVGALERGAGFQAQYLVRHVVPLLYEQVAKRIANIIDKKGKCKGAYFRVGICLFLPVYKIFAYIKNGGLVNEQICSYDHQTVR